MITEKPAQARDIDMTLWIAGLAITLTGLGFELWHGLSGNHDYDALLAMLSLSYEQNIPTWYSSLLLACIGLSLWRRSHQSSSYRVHWRFMAVGLCLASLDESIELHEGLGGLLGTSGLFYFDWVIPAGALVLLLALAFIPFTLHLPSRTRRRFIVAGSVYLAGALVMELPLGLWTEKHGVDNLGYALIDWLEESLEILGASLFLVAVLREEDAS